MTRMKTPFHPSHYYSLGRFIIIGGHFILTSRLLCNHVVYHETLVVQCYGANWGDERLWIFNIRSIKIMKNHPPTGVDPHQMLAAQC